MATLRSKLEQLTEELSQERVDRYIKENRYELTIKRLQAKIKRLEGR